MPAKTQAPAKKSKLFGAKINPAPRKMPGPAAPLADRGPSGGKMTEDRRYQAEDALATLTRAEKHRKDKRLMADVQKVAAEKMRDMEACVGGAKGKR